MSLYLTLKTRDFVVELGYFVCTYRMRWGNEKQKRLSKFSLAVRPMFSRDCEFLSWMEVCDEVLPPIMNFSTMPCGSQKQVVFKLDHPDMPALYGMGVFDYDAALGLAVFGNMFGELAVFDLSGTNVKGVTQCFEEICFDARACCMATVPDVRSISTPAQNHLTLHSKTPVPVTLHPPFPYLRGRVHPDSYHDQFFAHWQSCHDYPRSTIPEQWWLAGLGSLLGRPVWYDYTPLLPQHAEDRAWLLEHAHHIYGTVVPLATAHNLIVCHIGGLLYLLFGAEGDVYVAHHGMSLDAFLALLDLQQDYPRPLPCATECPEIDLAAWNRGSMPRCLWDWERLMLGRDRWAEMGQRGADIDPSVTVVEDRRDELCITGYALAEKNNHK